MEDAPPSRFPLVKCFRRSGVEEVARLGGCLRVVALTQGSRISLPRIGAISDSQQGRIRGRRERREVE
jgi:hypothetical protein